MGPRVRGNDGSCRNRCAVDGVIPAFAGMTVPALWEETAAVQRTDTSYMVPGQLFAPVLDWRRELLQRSTAPSSLRT